MSKTIAKVPDAFELGNVRVRHGGGAVTMEIDTARGLVRLNLTPEQAEDLACGLVESASACGGTGRAGR